MSLVEGVAEDKAVGIVKEIYEEMKQVRGWNRIPAIWRVMALKPEYLKVNWERYKKIMMQGQIDAKTKEMLALAVSMVNGCSY